MGKEYQLTTEHQMFDDTVKLGTFFQASKHGLFDFRCNNTIFTQEQLEAILAKLKELNTQGGTA